MDNTRRNKSTNSSPKIKEDIYESFSEPYRTLLYKERQYLQELITVHPRYWSYPTFRIYTRIFGGYLLGHRLDTTRHTLSSVISSKEVDSIIWLSATNSCQELFHTPNKFKSTLRNNIIQSINELLGSRKRYEGYYNSSISYTLTEEVWYFRIKASRFDVWEQYLIYLHVYEEMSIREIADLCGYAKSSVHKDLNRIMNILRQERQ